MSHDIFHPQAKVIIFVGNFGSGKTEISINYALQLKTFHSQVSILDLDVIKPYFRCRAATELMREHGIYVVIPAGEKRYADLPIIIPEIKGVIANQSGISILDVGGEDTGARVLSYLHEAFEQIPQYEFLLVVNKNRPFTGDWKGVSKILTGIEKSSGLKVTGIVSNNHLMQDTTAEMIIEGYELSQEVSKLTGLPIYCVAVTEGLEIAVEKRIDAPILSIQRRLLPPHLVKGKWQGI